MTGIIQKLASAWRRRLVREALAVAGFCLAIYAGVKWLPTFGRSLDLSNQFTADAVSTLMVLAASLAFVALVYLLRRIQRLRRERSERQRAKRYSADQAARLTTVFNNILQGILLFDADARLVVCNDYYLKMYNLSPDLIKPGVSLFEIFQHRIERGNLNRDPQACCTEVLTGLATKKVTRRVVETPDGREIAVTDYPMADGGWVATHEDRTELKRREESFRLLFDNNPMAMWLFDRESLDFVAVNDAALACYGYTREQFMKMKVTEARAGDAATAEANIRALPEVQNEEEIGLHKRADGTTFPVAVCSRIMSYGGRQVRLAAVNDITAQKLAENDLRRTKKFLDAVIENVPLPIVVKTVKDGRFTLINKASEALHGYGRDVTIGKTVYDILPTDHAKMVSAQDAECVLTNRPLVISDHTISTPTGDRIVSTTKVIIPEDDGSPEYILALIEDVTERKQAEKKIAHMALSDPLTDLPNRAAFNERLNASLAAGETDGRRFALLCMDLDGFKDINDIYGHAVGDTLLCQIADRLRSVGDGDFVARLGGDEFTMIAVDRDRAGLVELTDRLLAAFVEDFEVGGRQLPQTLSVGVACYPADGADAKTLLSNADAALYRAKAEGNGSVQFFKAEMATRLRERAALHADLKSAIQHNEIHLHYQPQLKIAGAIQGFEALSRWTSPTRGMVPPGEFIPIAEESTLILVLGEWVLREACREAASWTKPLNIAINVSPIQFRHGDLPRLVHSILLETGLAPHRLELEVTEGVLIDDFSRAVSILRRLKSLGVQIAMDDFGTGYSSLSYLRAFPFDKIKIDRSFISDLENNHQSTAIVRAVIGLGRSLDIPILAEGVETQAQHAFLAREGCSEVQGFLTGRPLAIEDYADVVGRKPIAATKLRAS